jgi:peptidoglycan/xylan/chitin deacetylase (PgdA/CDA1 family)
MINIYHCFPGGKHKVLTMSYDDGKQTDRRLVALFNRCGIKGTFHLNAGLMHLEERIPAAEIPALYRGHEVSAHTFTHPTISRCPLDQVAQQVIEDRKALEAIVGYPVRGMSYPNGSYSQQIMELLPHLGVEYSRIVGNSDRFAMPENWFAWEATCHHNHNLMTLARQFAALDKTQYFYMMDVWGHSYEFDNDNNWELIEEFCRFIGGREDIWYATHIEIVDYLKTLANLKFSAAGHIVYNPAAFPAWISVDGHIVKLPGGILTKLQ